VWAVTATAGFESAWADRDELRLHAKGRVVGQLPQPYWLSYELFTDQDAATTRLTVTATTSGKAHRLVLTRAEDGWAINGKSAPRLADALDCDLAYSPLTNTMPIIRHDLHHNDARRDFVMAFVEVPSLRVRVSHQSYTHIDRGDAHSTVRYSSGSFSSDLLIDPDGFVLDYPRLAHRIPAK
jgi:hypothetical protein